MKRLLILDSASNCLDLALRAQRAGWSVRWYDKPGKSGRERTAGRWLVEKIKDFSEIPRKWMDWADLIYLPDNAQWLSFLEPYRRKGYPILAPSVEAAALELDREVGQRALIAAGIQTIPTKAFKDYDSALAYVIKHPTFLVSKPSGDADRALSYVAHDPSDLAYMFSRWKRRPELRAAARTNGFILQEKKIGIEMAVGGWFGPHGFGDWWYENFEYKKLMDGDLGVNTGEMGTLSRMTRRSKLANQVLVPMAETLRQLSYVGYVDVNCIIDSQGPWPLEFTMRDGWPTKHNVTAHVKNADPIQWMLDEVNGTDSMEAIEGEVCVSVLIALPDFPYSHFTEKELSEIPISVNEVKDFNSIHPSEMAIGTTPHLVHGKLVDLPGWVTAGDYVMVVTGTGKTISSARHKAYESVKAVHIPASPFYRLDIGAGRMRKQLETLHKMGYAKGLEW